VLRPSGRSRVLLLVLTLLPILLGGAASLADAPGSGDESAPSDSTAYWLFLTDSAWGVIQGSSGTGSLPGRIRTRSQWLKALSIQLPQQEVPGLVKLPGVRFAQPVRRLPVPSLVPTGIPAGINPSQTDARDTQGSSLAGADSTYGGLGTALEILEVPQVHALGFMGTGTRIGILDGLFRSDHAAVRGNPPIAVRDFVDMDMSVDLGMDDQPEAASHGTALWSVLGGDWPGILRGPAPMAAFLLARITSDRDPQAADEDRWVAGLEWLETQGARIVLSGVGFRDFEGGRYTAEDLNGDVAPATLAADEAARRGVLVVAPVGNLGPDPSTLQSPADGDSVMAVGAANAMGLPSFFSAEGPTSDGRFKPDLLAPGEDLTAASGEGIETMDQVQGTEFAGALLAGAAALFVEAYPERGPMEVLQALSASADTRRAGFARVPRVASAVLFPDGVVALPSPEVDSEGQVTTLVPQFLWNVPTTHPFGLPVTFLLEFAEDSLFQGVLLRDSVVGTFARRIPEPLPPRTRFFWRVSARSTQGVTWTTSAQGPLAVPSWVALDVLNDPGGTQIAEVQPEFRWTAAELPAPSGPFTFELQILDDREGDVIQAYPGLEVDQHRIAEPLPFNVTLRWRVIAQARNGAADTVSSAGPFVVTGGENPPVTILYQNFPNPFPRPDEGVWETRIWFDLARGSPVQLAVFDMRGRQVRDLIPGRGCATLELPPGLYGREGGGDIVPCAAFAWDGRDDSGKLVSPGVYLLRLQADGVVEVRRVVYWP